MEERWCSPTPDGAAALLAGAGVPWWVAGGWAIDLFTGIQTRAHVDVDIGCFRQDLVRLLDQFRSWDVRVAKGGALLPLADGQLPDSTTHVLWLKPVESECWVLEILIEERLEGEWVYRRDERVRRPADEIVMRTREGIPYLRPEIQLLYKSKEPRPEDQRDFSAAWPLLLPGSKQWFGESLSLVSPDHQWLQDGES